MAKSLTAKVGAYSSVVGGGVHIHEPDGRFAGQVESMARMLDAMATREAARHIADGQIKP